MSTPKIGVMNRLLYMKYIFFPQVELEEKHQEITTLSSRKEEESSVTNKLLHDKDSTIKRLENEVEALRQTEQVPSNDRFEQLAEVDLTNFVRDILSNPEVRH